MNGGRSLSKVVCAAVVIALVASALLIVGCSGVTSRSIAGTWHQAGRVSAELTVSEDETEWSEDYSGLIGFGSSSGTIENHGDGTYTFYRGNQGNRCGELQLSSDGSMLMCNWGSSELEGTWHRTLEDAMNNAG